MPEDPVSVPRETLQALFDLAVGGMDFGSGFWETEDTENARAVAVLLGVDPMKGTPHNHMAGYPHPYEETAYWPPVHLCRHCSKALDGAPHLKAVEVPDA